MPDETNGNGSRFISQTRLNDVLLCVVGAMLLGIAGWLKGTLNTQSQQLSQIQAAETEQNRKEFEKGLADKELAEQWDNRFAYLQSQISDLRGKQNMLLDATHDHPQAVRHMHQRPSNLPTPTPISEDWTVQFKRWLLNQPPKQTK